MENTFILLQFRQQVIPQMNYNAGYVGNVIDANKN